MGCLHQNMTKSSPKYIFKSRLMVRRSKPPVSNLTLESFPSGSLGMSLLRVATTILSTFFIVFLYIPSLSTSRLMLFTYFHVYAYDIWFYFWPKPSTINKLFLPYGMLLTVSFLHFSSAFYRSKGNHPVKSIPHPSTS